MKRNRSQLLLVAVVATVMLQMNGCKKSGSNSKLKDFSTDPEKVLSSDKNIGSNPKLGQGYDDMEEYTKQNICVKGTEVYTSHGGRGTLTSTDSSDSNSILSTLGINTNINVSDAVDQVGTIKATAKYIRENTSNSNTWSYFQMWTYSPGFTDFDMKSLAIVNEFEKKNTHEKGYPCGNRYIQKIEYTAHAVLNLKIEFKDSSQKDTFNATIGANGLFKAVKGDGDITVDSIKEQLRNAKTISMHAVQVGGAASNILENAQYSVCGVSSFEECISKLSNMVVNVDKFRKELDSMNLGVSNIAKNFAPKNYTMSFYRNENISDLDPNDYYSDTNTLFSHLRENEVKRLQKDSKRIDALLGKGWVIGNPTLSKCFNNIKTWISEHSRIIMNRCKSVQNCERIDPEKFPTVYINTTSECAAAKSSQTNKIVRYPDKALKVPEFTYSFWDIDDKIEVYIVNKDKDGSPVGKTKFFTQEHGSIDRVMNQYWDGTSPYLDVDIYLKNYGILNPEQLNLKVAIKDDLLNITRRDDQIIDFHKFIFGGSHGLWKFRIDLFEGDNFLR